MFGTIRRHQKWSVPATFITVLCFVVFFSPTSKSGFRAATHANLGNIAGKPVSELDFRQAQAEVFIYYFLNHGQWPDTDTSAKQLGFDIEREIYFRLFFINKLEANRIQVSSLAVGEMAANILRGFGGRNGPATLEQFEQQALQPRGFAIADFRRFLQHQLALQQLVAVVGMSGQIVSPEEASSLFQLEHQQIATEAVFFSPSNLLTAVVITPDQLGQFFTNQMARYRVPDRVQVSYVRFSITNFLAEADAQIAKLTNFEQNVEAIYEQRGTNYYSEAKTPEAAKAKIKEEVRHEFAQRAARIPAAAFTDELLGLSAAQASQFDGLAAKTSLTVSNTAPFDAKTGPLDLEVTANFTKAAFKLTAEEPFAGPIPADDGVYVIALKKKLPSEIPSLDSIHAKVMADCQFINAAQLTYNIGTNFANTLAAGLEKGKTFSELCDQAGRKPVKIPAFSLSTRSLPEVEKHISLGRLQDIAFSVPAGNISGYIPTEDGGGLILHVVSRMPGDPAVKKDFPAFLTQVRATRQNEAFNRWFSHEAERDLRDTPLARQRQPQP